MSLHALPVIHDGTLLTYYGEVHRNTGADTACGKHIIPGRTASVSHVQAVVYQLKLCFRCYPANNQPGTWRRR